MVYAVCVVFIYYQIRKEIIMIKKMVVVVISVYVGINIIQGFTDVVESHTKRIERVAGY